MFSAAWLLLFFFSSSPSSLKRKRLVGMALTPGTHTILTGTSVWCQGTGAFRCAKVMAMHVWNTELADDTMRSVFASLASQYCA